MKRTELVSKLKYDTQLVINKGQILLTDLYKLQK